MVTLGGQPPQEQVNRKGEAQPQLLVPSEVTGSFMRRDGGRGSPLRWEWIPSARATEGGGQRDAGGQVEDVPRT